MGLALNLLVSDNDKMAPHGLLESEKELPHSAIVDASCLRCHRNGKALQKAGKQQKPFCGTEITGG